jgi:SAM-dependent methyltransferase
MDRTERQREHFNTVALAYHQARQDKNHLLLKDLIWREFLRDKGELRVEGLRVLEAMCGFADGKDILERHLGISLRYEGFDYSDAVVAYLEKERPELRVWQANVESFEIDKNFDAVVLLGGLHHVPHVAADVIPRLTACLRPGGWFINLEPTSGNRLFRRIRERIYERNALFDEETEQAFPVGEFLAMFTDAGLTPVDVIHPGLLAYVLYYNPDAFPRLNVGGERMVKAAFALDRLFLRNRVGRALSFATLGLWRKGGDGAGVG